MSEPPFYERYRKRACACCGRDANHLLFRQNFTEISSGSLLQGYDVVACDNCGFCFADHIPDQADFDAHYRDMSKYEYQDQGGQETEYDIVRFRAMRDMVIPFLASASARLLDVGCATGRLLAMFREASYGIVVGLDPSHACAQAAYRLYGIRVLTGSISQLGEVLAAEQPFDCAILSGVLEHIRDLEPALLQIRAALAEDGIVFIEVPDATDFARWPDAPFQEFSTEHIGFFSGTSLTNLMRRHGFAQVLSEQSPRDQTQGTVMPVVSAIYRKEAGLGPSAPVRDKATELGLRAYIRKSQEVEDRIQYAVDGLVASAKPIIVWGVGTHTQRLLATSRLAEANIVAFVDSNPHYRDKRLLDLPILAPSDLRNRPEAILISSRVFQSEIERQIRQDLRLTNEVITLYQI
jgi:SAM-dependent methyltransferase